MWCAVNQLPDKTKNLRNVLERKEKLDLKIIELTKENGEQKKWLAHYESENIISLTTSHNNKRRKFRERRGKNPNDNPGEKMENPDKQ